MDEESDNAINKRLLQSILATLGELKSGQTALKSGQTALDQKVRIFSCRISVHMCCSSSSAVKGRRLTTTVSHAATPAGGGTTASSIVGTVL